MLCISLTLYDLYCLLCLQGADKWNLDLVLIGLFEVVENTLKGTRAATCDAPQMMHARACRSVLDLLAALLLDLANADMTSDMCFFL